MTSPANVAATLMEHLCAHDWHGYDQARRWGDGEGSCTVDIDGRAYEVEQGDRDCSSAVIECWRAALRGTPYEGALDGATYTGNMRAAFTRSGLFEWQPMTYVAQRGDVYLNEGAHTAMCMSAVPDMLAEFSINEHGGITGGAVGDQTGRESWVHAYYDYPWDGILRYVGPANMTPAFPGRFRDVDPSAWYAECVERVAEAGAMTGYGDGTFGPEDPVTRAQLAAVIDRLGVA